MQQQKQQLQQQQHLCQFHFHFVIFWKSFHSGSDKFHSDTDLAAAGAAAASGAATVRTT